MKAPLYAAALFRSINESRPDDHARLVERFVMLVRARGHERLLPAIVRQYEKLVARRARTDHTLVTLARTEDQQHFAEEIARELAQLPSTSDPQVVIDERVVGGYCVSAQGMRVDRTHRRALLDLYQRLVNNF